MTRNKDINPVNVPGTRENLQRGKKRKVPPPYHLSENPAPGGSMNDVHLVGNALCSIELKAVPRDAGCEKEVPVAMVDKG